jgi:cation-transporting ATPase F
MEALLGKHWHHLPDAEVVELLGADSQRGLDRFDVEQRRERFGENEIPTVQATPAWKSFLLQFHQPLVYILLMAASVTLVFKDWVDASVIFGVVLINAIVGFLHETKAVRAMEALRRSLTTSAAVLRGGQWQQIPSTQLVPGDVVQVQSGDKVPADLRLLKVRNLQIAEAALTGESVPVEKQQGISSPETILAERNNMAWSGTLVTSGQGQGIVVATGGKTEIGRISYLIAKSQPLETPLTRKIAQFSQVLMYAILAFAVLAFVVGIVRGESVVETFKAAVALAVGAIPEGLPAAVTILLAIGMHRMSGRNAIIRKLPAVETLGSTTVVCSDKTGTLTQNQMTVREIRAANSTYKVTGEGYDPQGRIICSEKESRLANCPALHQTLLAGLLCNDARLISAENGYEVEGDPTEAALLVSARKGSVEREQEFFRRIDTLPFESAHQYMATLHEVNGGRVIFVKGAVERIVERCTRAWDAANVREWNPGQVLREADEMAAQGLRVLAFARSTPSDEVELLHHDQLHDLQFLGLQGMIDPPRPEAQRAIEACQAAGVRVKMITGDHAQTAAAIAQQLGIQGSSPSPRLATPANPAPAQRPPVTTGQELAVMSDEQLTRHVEETSVFARVSPEQKLRLVKALQASNHIVAMTGDGVNDAPALRQADIGIAMGITGTEVSKEAADMVLTDDNFASIEAAIEEGRSVFDNLTKFIVWTLPTNLGEGLVILVAVLAGINLPILPTQILWINMTTAVLLGIMLAFEPKEVALMSRPPRNPEDPILTSPMIRRIAIVGLLLLTGSFGLFEWALWKGLSDDQARTVAVNLFVFAAAAFLWNCRSLQQSSFSLGWMSNPWIWVGIGLTIATQLAFTYLPTMNVLFHSAAIGFNEWIAVLLVAAGIGLAVEAEKALQLRFNRVRVR